MLFVEDVIDTGLTLSYLLRNLRARGPPSLEVCTLFDKPQRRLTDVPVRYKGFDLPDRFVVGYGLDYKEAYRHLPYVAELTPEVLGLRGDPGATNNGVAFSDGLGYDACSRIAVTSQRDRQVP